MDTVQLVKWLMGQPVNWMADTANFREKMSASIKNLSGFAEALDTICNQPPLPLGEWFTPTTKHSYCFGCGEWVAVEHTHNYTVKCAKCGYIIAVEGFGGWRADGDTDEYVWVASEGRYVYIDDLGSDLPFEDEERVFIQEVVEDYFRAVKHHKKHPVEMLPLTEADELVNMASEDEDAQDYPMPTNPPEWMMASHHAMQHPAQSTARPVTFAGYVASLCDWE
jgi:hypothetical protein